MRRPNAVWVAPSVRAVCLETPRLILREHEPTDAPAVLEYAADPEVLRYRNALPATLDQVEASLGAIEEQRNAHPLRLRYELAIVRRADSRLIGWLPLLLSGEQDRQDAEIGWTLARQFWSSGYATEAAQAVLAFGFETLGLHRIWARCDAENAASRRIMEKLRLRQEGELRQYRLIKGSWRNELRFALIEDEWWAQRRSRLRTD